MVCTVARLWYWRPCVPWVFASAPKADKEKWCLSLLLHRHFYAPQLSDCKVWHSDLLRCNSLYISILWRKRTRILHLVGILLRGGARSVGWGYSWKGWARDRDRIFVNLPLQHSWEMMVSVTQTLDWTGRDTMNLENFFFFYIKLLSSKFTLLTHVIQTNILSGYFFF